MLTAAQTLLILQMLLVLLPAREETQDTGEPSPKNNPPKERQQIHLHNCNRSGQPRESNVRLEMKTWPSQQARSHPACPTSCSNDGKHSRDLTHTFLPHPFTPSNVKQDTK